MMEPITNGESPIKKQEDDDKGEKRDIKPIPKTLNRVPRACNACRKQKMRCEGADNPPCKRCRNAGLECLFEKPSREATLTGEAGLERIRSLEAHVAEIRSTQNAMANSIADLVHQLRASGLASRSPATAPPSSYHPSPSVTSPTASTPTVTHVSPAGNSYFASPHAAAAGHHNRRSSLADNVYTSSGIHSHSSASEDAQTPHGYGNNHQGGHNYDTHAAAMAPPFNNTTAMGPPHGGNSGMRYSGASLAPQQNGTTRSKRQAPSSSNATSAHSSDIEDDEGQDLPAYGLVAPWEVLRSLAETAPERAAKELAEGSIESTSRTRTPSPERQTRRHKKRKVTKVPPSITFSDVVTKGIITEAEAQELFKIFYDGCSTFLPVFDPDKDTFDALHERSPFAVNSICMVAARVRDGGGKMSEVHRRLLEEVQSISSATLFTPVVRTEAIQSMILVSGWSDNGWLSGGHAVRMAMEFSLHRAWPRLLKKINNARSKAELRDKDNQDLVIACRTWFCLYLFEHQLSYGTGRPAVLKNDDSIKNCRYLLEHPFAIEDDMRLVSTVELVAIRERVHNFLSPLEGPIKPEHYEELNRADIDFRNWYATWDETFSAKYENAAFYRQSLQIQHLHAELFHNASVLRNIISPEDVTEMGEHQRRLALRSIDIARKGLDITLNSPAYRKGMTYAVHYTHATATFAASFLLRLARLFPNQCNMDEVRDQVERLASLMMEIPGKRYALTLQLMLKRSKRKQSQSRSPKVSRSKRQSMGMSVDQPGENMAASTSDQQQSHDSEQQQQAQLLPQQNEDGSQPQHQQPLQQQVPQHHQPMDQYGASYEASGYAAQDNRMHGSHPQHMMPDHYGQQVHHPAFTADQIWRDVEQQNPQSGLEQTWISDQTLGGQSFSQHGMDAFMIPTEFLPVIPQQIW